MNADTHDSPIDQKKLYKIAFGLAVFTIAYNAVEGLVSTYFGYQDETLALFGFGVDSFIEVISGCGIAHMILRIRKNPQSSRDPFERTALTVTGYAFYALAAGLTGTALYNTWTHHVPETTLWGIVISMISIAVMWLLVQKKKSVGKLLHSDAILADAECTKVCITMSLILLLSSGTYELIHFAYIDIIGTFGLAYVSWKEGRECFEKAKGNLHCLCHDD